MRTIAIFNLKGGVAKTVTAATMAYCLASDHKRSVLCIDADVGLRNLDIALGMADLSVASFADVIGGRCSLSDAAAHPALPVDALAGARCVAAVWAWRITLWLPGTRLPPSRPGRHRTQARGLRRPSGMTAPRR